MAQIIRLPSETVLPRSAWRDFVELLHNHYRAAHRPTLREITDQIDREEREGAASRETIRRMLVGQTVPTNWKNVRTVFLALCELAGRDPIGYVDERPYSYGAYERPQTHAERLEAAWHAALDEGQPRSTAAPVPAPDPWSDEPPF